jgi:hypothetical protein
MNEKQERQKNGMKEEKRLNIWMILTFMFAGVFIASLYLNVAPKDLRNLEYRWCIKNFKHEQSIGEYCCTENPYNTTENKCAYYHEGKDWVEVKANKPLNITELNSLIGGVE